MLTTPKYSAQELLEDAQGYGRVLYVACGSSLVHLVASGSAAPRLAGNPPACFVGSQYAILESTRAVTLYPCTTRRRPARPSASGPTEAS